jgi:hypothetical protein
VPSRRTAVSTRGGVRLLFCCYTPAPYRGICACLLHAHQAASRNSEARALRWAIYAVKTATSVVTSSLSPSPLRSCKTASGRPSCTRQPRSAIRAPSWETPDASSGKNMPTIMRSGGGWSQCTTAAWCYVDSATTCPRTNQRVTSSFCTNQRPPFYRPTEPVIDLPQTLPVSVQLLPSVMVVDFVVLHFP